MRHISGKRKAAAYRLSRIQKGLCSHWWSTQLLRMINARYAPAKARRHDVGMGLTYGFLGGIKNHMLAIQKHSRLNISIIPDDKVLSLILKHQLQTIFQDRLSNTGVAGYPLVHSHVDPWFIRICAQAASRGTKWVHTYHLLYFEDEWKGGLQPWQEEVNCALVDEARHAHVRISVARWLQELLESQYGITSLYIPNGVDVAKCDSAIAARFAQRYGHQGFILFAASIQDRKNPQDFVRLAQQLPERPFLMVGTGISRQAVTEDLGMQIPPNLTVMDALPHEELLDAIAACRVFVMTSKSEGLPTVVMEAMALQKPVVGCNRYGTGEVIGDSRFGYIYKHDSIGDLVEKASAAWDNPTIGAAARQRVLDEYDWTRIIGKLDAVYSELL